MATSSRPHILFLSQCLPYPPDSGVTARTFNVLRQLQKEFDITLVAFSRSNHQPDAGARRASWQALAHLLADVYEPVLIASEHSVVRRLWDHLRSVASGRAYTFYVYWSRDFRAQLRNAILVRSPDLIHLDSLDLHRWLRELPSVTTTCTHHDVDSELLRRRASRVKSFVSRKYMLLQAGFVERMERELCPHFSANIMMSELDAERLQNLAPGSRTVVVPNGVDTEYFTPVMSPSPVPGRVIFIGSPLSFPNRDAVDHLLADIWPQIRSREGSATLQLIGRCSAADRIRYASHPGVTCEGHVSDTRPRIAEACCCLAPIRVGGGTRVKILDAWAMGKPVVSTSIGCEGLKAFDGENILIRDTPQTFAQAVLEILSDSELRLRLGRSGRRTAEQTYSWDVVGHDLRAFYWSRLQALTPSPEVQ